MEVGSGEMDLCVRRRASGGSVKKKIDGLKFSKGSYEMYINPATTESGGFGLGICLCI